MTASFVLPTYNEKDNIIILIKAIQKSVKKVTRDFEIIVVDDNSPDRTGYICRKYFGIRKDFKVYIRKKERGFASAILYGIKKARGTYIIVMDTDFSHDPEIIPSLLSKIKNCDIVIGSRYMKNGGGENKVRYWLSKVYNLYLRHILRIKITDFLFGFFCVRKSFLIKNNLLSKNVFKGFGDYFIRLAYYVSKSNGIFLEIPAFYKSRIHGKTKSNITNMLFTYTTSSLRLFLQDLFS